MVLPFVVLAFEAPDAWGAFGSFGGTEGAGPGFSWVAFGLGTGVALSLIAQIGEQADYLRFLPARTEANKRRWNLAVLAAGPGWVIIGAAKQLGGALLAFIAAGPSLVLCPLIAWATKGKYCLARPNPVNGPDVEVPDITATHTCAVCETAYELPDIADCPVRSGPICSLCCSLDDGCGDVCRKEPASGPVLMPMPTVRGTAG
ncbi:hypothetical protein A6A29_01445 [Streptomyces sp. TSRI0281]|nr:hypothetical protein A6A29_01445 [Streptomyces sp. TSRI0281]